MALDVSPRNTCDKGIHPFNAELPYSYDNNAIAHKYDDACRADMEPFPGQHKQPVNPDTNNPAKTNVDVSGFMHEHIYWNDSSQYDGTNNYYYAYVSRFEITLEADFMKNVDLTTLRCAPPPKDPYDERSDTQKTQALNDFKDCDGYDSIMWGGTRVTRVGNKITYTFGTEYADWKPILPGKNPSIDEGVYFNGNTLSENSTTAPYSPRLLGFQIDGYTKKNITDKAWSATTTSRALIKHVAIPQNAFNTGKNHNCFQTGYDKTNSWCPVNVSSSYTREPGYSQETHWFPIGTVSTVWKDVTPPPTCASATLTAKQNGQTTALSALQPSQPIEFTVTPTYDPSNKTVPLKYKWTAKSGSTPKGNFRDSSTTPNQPADGSFIDDDPTVYYTGSDDVTIVVEALYSDGTPATPCKAQATIAKEIKYCTGLKITAPGAPTLIPSSNPKYDYELSRNTSATFTVSPSYFENKPVALDYKWYAKPEDSAGNTDSGDFKDSSTSSGPQNPYTDRDNLFGPDDTNTYYSGSEGGTIISVQGVAKGTENYVGNDCETKIYIPPPEPPPAKCESITLSPAQLSVPGSTELEATVKFNDGKYYNATVKWQGTNGLFSNGQNASTSAKQLSNAIFSEEFATSTSATEANITVEVISVEGAENSDKCEAGISGKVTINPVCESVTLSPDVPTVPGTTDLTANVTFSDGKEHLVTLQFSGENGLFKNDAASSEMTQSSTAPFTETFSTEESSASITAKVIKVVDQNVENSPACQKGITIRKTTNPECRTLKIMRNNAGIPNEILTTDSTSNMYLNVEKSENYNLNYIWTVEGEGTLTNAVAKTITTTTPEQNVNLTGIQNGTVLTVKTTDKDGQLLRQCSDSFTVKEKEETGQCENLQVVTSPSSIYEGETVKISIIGATYSEEIPFAGVKWSQNGSGTFNNITSAPNPTQYQQCPANNQAYLPASCPANPTTGSTISPCCQYSYTASNAGDSFSIEAVPNSQYEPNCKFTRTVIKKDTPPPPPPPPPGSKCKPENTFDLIYDSNQKRFCVVTNYAKAQFVWFIGNVQQSETGRCLETDNKKTITVLERLNPRDCNDKYTPPPPPTETPNPPSIKKEMFIDSVTTNGWYSGSSPVTIGNRTNIPPINYKITVTPNSDHEVTATVVDTISQNGEIKAVILPTDKQGNTASDKSKIIFKNQTIKENGTQLSQCNQEQEEDTHCFNNSIGQKGGIELVGITGQVTIEYTGTLVTGLTDEICRDGQVCQEKYENTSVITKAKVGNKTYENITSNTLNIQLFCEYILTRAAGDIFLEEDLGYGVDILQCSDFSSSTGLIITPGPEDKPTLISTGTGNAQNSTFAITHEICSQGQTAGGLTGTAADLYGQNVVGQLSSQICEVKLRPGGPWRQQIITNSIEENKARVARWEADYQSSTNYTSLKIQIDQKDVFFIKGANNSKANLTINEEFKLSDGQGAKTFIIENGDLIIDANIKYGECTKSFCTVRDTASLAFIVLNGNIIIDKDVEEISGVFYVQEGATTGTGQILPNKDSKGENEISLKGLTVKGSIYGDILPLFQSRAYAGDPGKDEGGIVIRFDERILLNTPPGIGDIVDLSQTEVAR